MFDRIAPVYDVMNRVMTVGLDRRWRRLTVEAVVQPGARVLDACCGTGDLAIAAEREGGIVTGLDFSGEMLVRARRKSSTIEWVQGDVLALPYADGSFDAATVGFGVRNVADLGAGAPRAAPRPAPRRPARDPRDHPAARPPEAVLLALVRPDRAAARPRAAGREGLHLPAGERPPVSRRRGPRGADRRERDSRGRRFRLFGGTIVALHTATAR